MLLDWISLLRPVLFSLDAKLRLFFISAVEMEDSETRENSVLKDYLFFLKRNKIKNERREFSSLVRLNYK